MSNGYRNGAFALGLVVGGGLVINLFLWSAYYANKPGKPPSQNPEHAQNNSDVAGSWDWFFTTFINPTDTIAQWAMAILSLAAVYLLRETLKASRKTLKATQKMAGDTREIGEAQVRAYVNVERAEVRGFSPNEKIGFYYEFKNTGSTPAKRFEIRSICGFQPGEIRNFKVRDLSAIDSKSGVITAGGSTFVDVTMDQPLTEREYREITSGKLWIIIAGYVSYSTVFGRRKRTLFKMTNVGWTRDGALIIGPCGKNNRSN